MVAVLLRLRFRVLANTLRRNPWQLVAVILGGVQTLFTLLFVLGGLLYISTAPPAATQTAVVIGGSVLMLGWAVVPLLFDGVEQTLDAVKLARFPIRPGTLMVAMLLVGILWVPGAATLIAAAGTAIAWRATSLGIVVAVLTGLVGAVTAIAGSRLVSAMLGRMLRGRGAVRFGVLALVLLLLAGPVAAAALGRTTGGGRDIAAIFTGVVDILGWTPLGAIWSVPGRLVLGDAPGAFGAAAIGLATLGLVLVGWRAAIVSALRIRGGESARGVRRGRLGPLGRVPAGATGAIAARSLIYWFRDARQVRQLILLPVMPALMLLWWSLTGVDAFAAAAGPLVASLLPLSVFAGISYDGTAFAMELAAAVPGWRDRLGRAVALLTIALPSVVVVQIVVAIVAGLVGNLPALLGLSIGVLLTSLGVVSVSSARLVLPVPRSGRNPFSAAAGSATASVVASYAVMGATIVLAAPVIGLTIAALVTGIPALGWAACAVGVLGGAAATAGGIAWGGRMLDRSGPTLLARLHVLRG